MEHKSNCWLPSLSLSVTLLMFCMMKEAPASTLMAETKDFSKKATEPSEDIWQPARDRTTWEGWPKRLLPTKGPQEGPPLGPQQRHSFLNEWHWSSQAMNKRLVKRAISQPPAATTTPVPSVVTPTYEPPIDANNNMGMTMAGLYTFPDVYHVGHTYLPLRISTVATCHEPSHPSNVCSELILQAGHEGLSISIRFSVGPLYRRRLEECRVLLLPDNCTSTCHKGGLDVPDKDSLFRRIRQTIGDPIKCGLAYRKKSETLYEIYAAEEHCPLKVTHECDIDIEVSTSLGTEMYRTRFELFDENEMPDCSSPLFIRTASTWSEAYCFDRDDYLLTTCGAPGCWPFSRNSYIADPIPPGVDVKQAKSVRQGLRIRVGQDVKPFNMTLKVNQEVPGAPSTEKRVLYIPEDDASAESTGSGDLCSDNRLCDDDEHACPSNQYWDVASSACKIRKMFNEGCIISEQCWSNLNCFNGTCWCELNYSWDPIDSVCKMQETTPLSTPVRTVRVVRYEGWSAELFCPERSGEDAWKEEMIETWHRPDGSFYGSGIRLFLKYLQVVDSGIYFCRAGGKIVGSFDIQVYRKYQAESPILFDHSVIPFEFFIGTNAQSLSKDDMRVAALILGEHLRRQIAPQFPNVYRILVQHLNFKQIRLINDSNADFKIHHYYQCELDVIERYDHQMSPHRDEISRIIQNNKGNMLPPGVAPTVFPTPFNSGALDGLTEGDKAIIKLSFYGLHSLLKYQVLWQFGNQFLNATSYQAGASVVNSNVSYVDVYPPNLHQTLHTVMASLHIHDVKPAFEGEYRCHVVLYPGTVDEIIATDSKFLATVSPRPRVIMSPLSAAVAFNSTVPYVCDFRNVSELQVLVNGEIVREIAAEGSTSFKWSSSITTGSNGTEDVILCIARKWGGSPVRKELVIRSLLKDDATPMCDKSYDRRGTFWIAALQNTSPTNACPQNYVGTVTRTCSSNGTWMPSNYSACRREDLLAIEDKIEVLKLLKKPSPKELESITSDLTQSVVNSTAPVYGNDINEVVDILSQLSNVVSEKETEDGAVALLSDSALVDVAGLTDKLMTANQSDWKDANVDGMAGEPDTSGKVNASGLPAGRLVLAMDRLVSSTLNDSKMTTQTIVKKSLIIKRAKVSSRDNIRFPVLDDKAYQKYDGWVAQSQSSAFLPYEALPQNEDTVRYAALLYRGLDEKLQAPQKVTYAQSVCDPSPEFPSKQLMTDILSFSLNAKVDVLSPPLDLTFPVPQIGSGPVCVFLDTSTGSWSSDGCETVILEDGLVECHCDHLTNFAVLMSPAGTDIGSTHHQILSIITIIGCSISIVCLIITILAYALFWRFIKNDLAVLHLNLSVCLILSYIVFMAGINEICRESLCTFIAVLLHYVLLAVFFLMLSEGIEIMLSVSVLFSRKSAVRKLLLGAYGIPALLVLTSIAATHLKGYRSEQYCWLSWKTGTLWAFTGPALFVIVANCVLAVLILRVMATTTTMKNKEEAQKAKTMTKALLTLSSVLGIGWVFGILAVNSETIIFQYLFAVFNSLQGLCIFIFHCLLSRQIRNGFSAFYRRISSRMDDSSKTKSGSGPPVQHSEQKELAPMKEDSNEIMS